MVAVVTRLIAGSSGFLDGNPPENGGPCVHGRCRRALFSQEPVPHTIFTLSVLGRMHAWFGSGPGAGLIRLRLAATRGRRIMYGVTGRSSVIRDGPSMSKFQLVSPYPPAGDQPAAIESLVDGLRRGKSATDAHGRHRLGQDLHHGQRDRPARKARAGHVAQQDPRRAALRRVQGVLPAQRGPLLRQLLRLLSARGVYPPARHLHRERCRDQRGDRAPPPRLHQRAGQPRGCGRRRQHLVHLRVGIAGRLPQDDGAASAWATSSIATRCS